MCYVSLKYKSKSCVDKDSVIRCFGFMEGSVPKWPYREMMADYCALIKSICTTCCDKRLKYMLYAA